MKPIQIVLMLALLGVYLWYLRHFRSAMQDRAIALVLCILAVVAIIVPGLTQQAADFLGVGRGTDLVLYIWIVTSIYGVFLLYTRLDQQKRAITELARAIALENPTFGSVRQDIGALPSSDAARAAPR